MQAIIELQQQALAALDAADTLLALEAVRVAYLGKKGELTQVMKGLMHLSAEEKPQLGQWVNEAKRVILARFEARHEALSELELQKQLVSEHRDVTLPGRYAEIGSLHPVTQVKQRVVDYFVRLGFDCVEGPEIETEAYNFQSLNIPAHHPARAMHDTFYFGDGRLLRTHTSTVQVHCMESAVPPFRLIAPGRVYRCDSDVTHTPMFHQLEGLFIDEQVTLAGLKGLLRHFFADFFGKHLAIRFRPSYFPFTEPSAEVDIACTHCDGAGCRSCQFTGWLEVLGCGMVHPNVLEGVGISSKTHQGWAFGLGLDRLAMLYFGIDDLRTMFENDLDFLAQF